jgi:uncharacterized protein (TIGR02996 family)
MNPDIERWLEQVATNPDDTTTRLVFADWLQDRDHPAAEAVRNARDAAECLLEFPLQTIVAGEGEGIWRLEIPPVPVWKTLRPFLRVTGLEGWRLSSAQVLPVDRAGQIVGIWAVTEHETLWTQHLHYQVELGATRQTVFMIDWCVRYANNVSVCLQSDRPLVTGLRVCMESWPDPQNRRKSLIRRSRDST